MQTRIVMSFLAVMALMPSAAHAFGGLYASKSQAPVLNQASKIVVARHDNRTVMTIAADFQGGGNHFAMIIPVPGPVSRGQINITENRIIDQLDAYTAPRLTEFHDDDPCLTVYTEQRPITTVIPMGMTVDNGAPLQSRGVSVEEEFAAGEYDIKILTADQGKNLAEWLRQGGYTLPAQADDILGDYIDDGMNFFMVSVNLLAFDRSTEKTGYHYLRPIQVAYESDRLILPMQLGTLNAAAPQDMLVFALTQTGRAEPVNYPLINLPSGADLPLYAGARFDDVYRDMFAYQTTKEEMKPVFLEYAWDMAWCDPCTAEPPAPEDLMTLGAWWLERPEETPVSVVGALPGGGGVPQIAPVPAPVNVFVTRLHMRYTPETLREDMELKVTDNRQNFQTRFILRQPWIDEIACERGASYFEGLPDRFEKEAQTLSSLTGWDIDAIRTEMKTAGQPFDIKPQTDSRPWWEQMWENQQR